MDIRVKEPLYASTKDGEYIIRPGTVGREHKKIIFFWDSTGTASIGFSKEFCLDNPQTFQVSRTLSDREVSVKDVLKVVEKAGLDKDSTQYLLNEINSL